VIVVVTNQSKESYRSWRRDAGSKQSDLTRESTDTGDRTVSRAESCRPLCPSFPSIQRSSTALWPQPGRVSAGGYTALFPASYYLAVPSFPVRLSTPRPDLHSNALTPEIVLLKYRFKPSKTVGLGQPPRLCAGRQRDDVARSQSTTDERSGCTWPAVGLSPDSTCEPA
jgi:hypothetical protein